MIRPTILVLLACMMVGSLLAGCGKRPRNLEAPPGANVIYPKKYPPADAPGDRL